MEIKNNELVIRTSQAKDAQILTNWWNDGKVMEHAGFPLGLQTSLEKTLSQIAQNSPFLQLCIIEYCGKPIGEMSYTIKDSCAQIGIKICEFKYQNKGLGSALLMMFIDYLFSSKDICEINKIILDTNKKNLRAQRVYEKLGFEKLRENINSWQDQLKVWQTSVDYELTRARWMKIQSQN